MPADLELDLDPEAFGVLLRCMRLGGCPALLLPSAVEAQPLLVATLLTAEALGVGSVVRYAKAAATRRMGRSGDDDDEAAAASAFDETYPSLGAALETAELRRALGLRAIAT